MQKKKARVSTVRKNELRRVVRMELNALETKLKRHGVAENEITEIRELVRSGKLIPVG
jgi:hypothetical protein